MYISDISVVICNKNSIGFLKKSIPVYKRIKFKEIFVIDGESIDGSKEYLKDQNIKFYSDRGKGLSYSRQMGVSKSRGDFIFMAGPDDICDEYFFTKLCAEFKKTNFDAATTLLKIKSEVTYWDKSLNNWYSYIRKLGKTNIVGTPTIFKREIFQHIGYEENTIGCDDTDISNKLIKSGYNLGVIDTVCDQANFNNFEDIKKKFNLYGKSDLNYYKYKNSNFKINNWANKFIHPLRHFVKFSYFLVSKFKIQFIFFSIIITFYRIRGSI